MNNNTLYAGFWVRAFALLIDGLILFVLGALVMFINQMSTSYYYLTLVPSLLLTLFYHVYLVQKNEGTPGKNIMKIKIKKVDGNKITWIDALKRYSLNLLLWCFSTFVMLSALSVADDDTFQFLSWLEKQSYLASLNTSLFNIQNVFSVVILVVETLVFVLNEKNRALHDFIAGTVVIHAENEHLFTNDIGLEDNLIL